MWGAVIAGAIQVGGSLLGKSSAKRAAKQQENARNFWTTKYEQTLDSIERQQLEDRTIVDASNETQTAQFKRGIARQSKKESSAMEAAAYIGGVSNSSSAQAFNSSLSLQTASALTDMAYRFDLSMLQSESAQNLTDLQRTASYQSGMANMYGGAIQGNLQAASAYQSQAVAGIGNVAGSIAGKYWG